jgi:DNA polymerase-3 subunit gamma/tau
VLTKADYEIRGSTQPRYHLELALLRWIHLRKLVPLSDMIQGLEKGGAARTAAAASATGAARPAMPAPPPRPAVKPAMSNAATVRAVETRRAEAAAPKPEAPAAAAPPSSAAPSSPAPAPAAGRDGFKDALFAELQKSKKFFYGTVIAQAQRIDVEGDRLLLAFAPQHKALKQQLDQSRPWLEEMATRIAGRKISVAAVDGAGPPAKAGDAARGAASGTDQQSALKQKAMADSGVQAMLDVFGTDIKEVEEI